MTYIEAVRELDELSAMIGRSRDAEAIRTVLKQAAWMRSRLLNLANRNHVFPSHTVAKAALAPVQDNWVKDFALMEASERIEFEVEALFP